MKPEDERYPGMSPDERAARLARNGNGHTVLRKVRNKFVDEASGSVRKKVGAGIIVSLSFESGQKPADVIRAFRRFAASVKMRSIMPVEFAGGTFNGRGEPIPGKEPSPTAFQVIGPRSALKAIQGHWTVRSVTYATTDKPPQFPQDKLCQHSPIPKDVSDRTARNIRSRFRSRTTREALEGWDEANRIHVNNPESPHHEAARRVAERNAHEVVMLAYPTSEMTPEQIRVVVDGMTEFIMKKGRIPDSREEFERS